MGTTRHYKKVMGVSNKNIYTVWWQGLDNCPRLCQLCIDSWSKLNPSWRVHIIDKNNIHSYIDKESVEKIQKFKTITTQTDLMRLYILKRYGGLYTDATNLCAISLDNWLHQDLLCDEQIWFEEQLTQNNDDWQHFPTFNFLYADRPSKLLGDIYGKIIDNKDLFSGSYMRIVRAFSELFPTHLRKQIQQKQIGSNRNWPPPKIGTKIIANGESYLKAPAGEQFVSKLKGVPFFKLTWKRNDEIDVGEKFDPIDITAFPKNCKLYAMLQFLNITL